MRIFFTAFLYVVTILSAGTSGKIKGKISDESGNPLAGANVIVNKTNLGAAADANGIYYILNVPPGSYSVSIQMIGYKSFRYEDVKVQSDLTTVLDAQLEVTVLESEDEVTVIASKPMIQKDATASASVISSDVIANSPIESFQAIVQTKAGVSVDAGGALHFRGGRSNEIAYLVDGIPNVNPYHSGLGVDIATNAIQELSVITGSFAAEYGQAMSGIINIVTKDPSREYHGSISVMGGDLMSNYDIDINDKIQQDAQLYDINNSGEIEATFSGPIPFFNKLRFFSSMRLSNQEGYLYGLSKYSAYGALKDTSEWNTFPMNPSQKLNGQAKLTYYLSNKIRLQYNFLSEDNYWKSYSHSRKYLENGHYQNFKRAMTHMIKITHQMSSKYFYTLGYSKTNNNYEYYSYKNEDNENYVWGGYYVKDSNYEFYTGGTNSGRYDRKLITDLITAQLTGQINNQHELKTGFEYKRHDIFLHTWSLLVDRRDEPWTDVDGNDEYDDGEEFTDLNGDGVWSSAKDDNNDGIYGNIIVPSIGPSNSTYTHVPVEISAYVQDKIELNDMVMNIGVRWDYYDPDGVVAQDWNNPNPDSTKLAVVKSQFSPRFSLAYPITDRGKLFFSYGHFFQMPPYYRLYTNPDFDVLPGVIKSDIGNSDLKPQKTISYEVGFEQQVSSNAAIYAKVFYRDMRNLLGQRIYILPGGSDSYALFINRDWGNVKGFTLSYDQRFNGFISGSIDYTYQIVLGNESNPTRTRRDYRLSIEPQKKVVYLDWDQPHAFRFVLNAGRPNNWQISTIGRIESGYPYTPKDANAIVRIAEENSGRKPNQINVDVSVYKSLNFNIGQSKISNRFFLKVYNLFDHRNENYVWDSSGRAGYSLGRYGDESTDQWINRPNWYSKPRQVYLGFSVQF